MSAAQLHGGLYNITLRTDDLEMIVQVREGRLQIGAHSQPCFRVDRLGDSVAVVKVVCEHGFCILELTLLDGIHKGLYGFSFIHNAFLYY